MGDHCGFQSALPVEISESKAEKAVEHDGAGHDQRGQRCQHRGEGQMAEAEQDGGKQIGDPKCSCRRVAVGRFKNKACKPDQQADGKQAKLDLFGSLQKNEASNTGKIAPGPGQNELARAAADASASKPCL